VDFESFDVFFRTATGKDPYPFQRRFATSPTLPQLVQVPTGLGKTAMVVLGWLWRRLRNPELPPSPVPRRLVYCLPMRVLVEQTRDNTSAWLEHLKLLPRDPDSTTGVYVHVLMGGETTAD